jgi:hypothetical protein
MTVLGERDGDRLGTIARGGIDDAAGARVAGDKIGDLRARLLLGAKRRPILGRSKEWTSVRGGRGNSCAAISARVVASAVAVNATICTGASASRTADSCR